MTKLNLETEQLREGVYEMEAAVDRLREEIQQLKMHRDALEQGNLELYRKLIQFDF
jgi:predicted RNase H-like nuclease (RuvC/YqgF family)